MKPLVISTHNRMPHFILAVLIILFSLLIYFFPNSISSDQGGVTYVFSWKNFPGFSDGTSEQLVIGIYNAIVHPSLEVVNTHIRIFILILYVLFAYLVALTVLKKRESILFFILILFVSRFPVLWLSRELIYGFLLCLCFLSFLRKWPVFLTCILVVFLAHAKPELAVISLAFLLLLLWQKRSDYKTCIGLILIFAGFNVLLFLPEIFRNELHTITSRSFSSFKQHYADLFYPHQAIKLGDPFAQAENYTNLLFPDIKSMGELIFKYPKEYYDFVVMSIGHGVKRMAVLFHVFLLFIYLIYRNIRNKTYKLDLFGTLFLLSLLGAVPLVLCTFPHIRYMARYYPLALIFIFHFMENCRNEKDVKLSRYIVGVGLFITFVQFIKSWPLLLSNNYWMPD